MSPFNVSLITFTWAIKTAWAIMNGISNIRNWLVLKYSCCQLIVRSDVNFRTCWDAQQTSQHVVQQCVVNEPLRSFRDVLNFNISYFVSLFFWNLNLNNSIPKNRDSALCHSPLTRCGTARCTQRAMERSNGPILTEQQLRVPRLQMFNGTDG